MKIMFWNIFKLGSTKLIKKMNQGIIAPAGMGNTHADYITKVALGDAIWRAAAGSNTPVDALVIIELISGGHAKGDDGTGSCLRCLNALKGALNTAAKAKNLSPLPTYGFVDPLITGNKETVGVLYNTATLTSVSSEVMRDTSNGFLHPRSPFWVAFDVVSSGMRLNLVGVHGPTSAPTTDQYTNAVVFTNKLANVAQIAQTGFDPVQATLIGGDYNCDGGNSYPSGNGNGTKKTRVSAFSALTSPNGKYSVPLSIGTRTSLLKDADQSTNPPGYLSQPYDNIVCLLPGQTMPPVNVSDLCAGAPVWKTNPVSTFNAARAISDHLPVTIEW